MVVKCNKYFCQIPGTLGLFYSFIFYCTLSFLCKNEHSLYENNFDLIQPEFQKSWFSSQAQKSWKIVFQHKQKCMWNFSHFWWYWQYIFFYKNTLIFAEPRIFYIFFKFEPCSILRIFLKFARLFFKMDRANA